MASADSLPALDFDVLACIQFVCVRIIKERFLMDAVLKYPKAKTYIAAWRATVRAARWQNMVELQNSYRSADLVHVTSRKPVVVFNVCGNDFRLITAVHFRTQIVYTLRFLTHAEYSRNKWKDEL
jgi:mRNA interferase HigB